MQRFNSLVPITSHDVDFVFDLWSANYHSESQDTVCFVFLFFSQVRSPQLPQRVMTLTLLDGLLEVSITTATYASPGEFPHPSFVAGCYPLRFVARSL